MVTEYVVLHFDCMLLRYKQKVNCYEIGATGVVPRAQIRHDGPVLCSDISSTDQVTTFTGGTDCSVRLWNVTQPATSVQVIGTHDKPVS